MLAGLGKARIIGVDTPEVYGGAECYGREASAFARRVLDGGRVRYTVGREDRDRYGRLLVYLWLPDGRSFNALLGRPRLRDVAHDPAQRRLRRSLRRARAARPRARPRPLGEGRLRLSLSCAGC